MIGIETDFADLSRERSYSLSNYTKGALLYMVCCHVVRSVRLQAQTSECLGFLCHWRSGQGFPLHRFAAIPKTKMKRRN